MDYATHCVSHLKYAVKNMIAGRDQPKLILSVMAVAETLKLNLRLKVKYFFCLSACLAH